MVNGPAAEHGATLLKDHGYLDLVGLHLNLTEGSPVASPEKVPSLLRAADSRSDNSSTYSEKSSAKSSDNSTASLSVWELLPGPLFLGKVQFTEDCRLGTIVEAHVQHEARAQVFKDISLRTYLFVLVDVPMRLLMNLLLVFPSTHTKKAHIFGC